jgi:hypothetical protein
MNRDLLGYFGLTYLITWLFTIPFGRSTALLARRVTHSLCAMALRNKGQCGRSIIPLRTAR